VFLNKVVAEAYPSWTAPLWISRFGASHGFYTETVASAKTANSFGNAANIETFDATWRCPVKKHVLSGDGLAAEAWQ